MSFMSRVFMTTGVAVANGHTDQGHKLKSGIKSIQHGKKAFTSSVTGADATDLRPLSGVLGSDVGGEQRRNQTDDSLRQVMYMNCWGPT
nr:serine/threonine-protein kinase [Tanacetum cinerariifolium]